MSFLLPDECGPRTDSYPRLSDPRVAFRSPSTTMMSCRAKEAMRSVRVELVFVGVNVAVGGCIAGDHLQTLTKKSA